MVRISLQATAHASSHVTHHLAFCLPSPAAALAARSAWHAIGPWLGRRSAAAHVAPRASGRLRLGPGRASAFIPAVPAERWLMPAQAQRTRGTQASESDAREWLTSLLLRGGELAGDPGAVRGGEWWDWEAPLQPEGKRAAERSGWAQTLVQPPSSRANQSTSHNLWRLGSCHLYGRDAEARNTCYIATSRWHLAQRQGHRLTQLHSVLFQET